MSILSKAAKPAALTLSSVQITFRSSPWMMDTINGLGEIIELANGLTC